ncbi:30S ribosomal protein S19 [Candidatus Woesearchaeota archaeon]|nr:30S ribosomal protein S19 [Candidatus Woesearchaeota archaeon]
MAKKEFTYRGLSEEELSKLTAKEFAELATSRVRRNIKRGFRASQKIVLDKLQKKGKVKTHSRDLVVLPEMIGKTIDVYNGKEFRSLTITSEMVGRYLGEFSLSKSKVSHSNPGVGATKSSSSVSVK